MNTGDRVTRLFHTALDLIGPDRSDFLRRECGDDGAVLAEVESLLAADASAGGFLEPVRASWGAAFAPGSRLGRYRIVRLVGTGGMGAVYEAEQDRPRRTVALKVMSAWCGSPGAARRFEYEAEALARLHHPGIAQVHEAGVLESAGRRVPFIAMEWVAGAGPITDQVRKAGLGLRARVELAARVCDAVEHAHRHGVIHRDLKPANILSGADGEPRLIDFGVARILDPDRAGQTLEGQIIGTPEYMSPEQCAGDPTGVDTRTDVYSMGVVLYELLTDRLPLDLNGATLYQAAQIIRETPARPPSAVRPDLRGDLETIVLRALEKDRDRRYASCAALARDLRAFLAGGVVEARRDSTWYVLRKTLRRHRVPVGATCILGVGVAASAVALGFMYARETRLLTQVRQREVQTRHALVWLQEALASLDPNTARWGDTRALRAMLDDASKRVGAELADQPESEAAMRRTMGRLYRAIGLFDPAVEQLLRAVEIRRTAGPADELAGSLSDLGEALQGASRYPQAETCLREALRIREALHPTPHPDLARSLYLAAWPREVHRDHDGAEVLLRRSLEMYRALHGQEHPDVARAVRGLGVVALAAGDPERAEPLVREALSMCRRLLGDTHDDTASCITTLAKLLHQRGREAEAEPLFREALTIFRSLYGDRHPNIAWARHRLGNLLHDQGHEEEARTQIEEAMALYREFQGENDPYTAFSLESLGTLHLDLGELEAAGVCFERALVIWRALEGEAFSDWHLNRMACLLEARGELADAEPLLRRSLAADPDHAAEQSPLIAHTLGALGRLLLNTGRAGEAAQHLDAAYQAQRLALGPDHRFTRRAAHDLERCRVPVPAAESGPATQGR